MPLEKDHLTRISARVPFQILEEAFGHSSLGILVVKDLPSQFPHLRHALLSYASYLANLPTGELGMWSFFYTLRIGYLFRSTFKNAALHSRSFFPEALSCPSANFLSGWSHGKEALKSGSYDTLKGSYYVNCAFYQGKGITVASSADFPELTAPNVWPAETSLVRTSRNYKLLSYIRI